jgi:menaquinone-dependent protoporphyrinogen IX oxidase
VDKVIVIYKSNTGFTEKYANWIAEELNCHAVSLEKINLSEAAQYETVVFGGGIHAGTVNGIRFIKNNLSSFKKIIVFATGATAPIPKEIERFRITNIPANANMEFFYFQSGMNYANMRGTDKMLMGLLKTVLKMKKNKSDVEQGTEDAIKNSYDYSDRIQIEPLINFVI